MKIEAKKQIAFYTFLEFTFLILSIMFLVMGLSKLTMLDGDPMLSKQETM